MMPESNLSPLRRADAIDEPRRHPALRLVLPALVVLYAAARLWRLTQFNLGRDEIFTLETARLGWRAMFAAVVNDVVHPPLFYLLLKIWLTLGGESLRWLKLFPALTAIVAVVPFLLLCRALRLRAATRDLALLLIAVNGYLVAYAHELRMYSLLFLFSLCALWLFVGFCHAERPTKLALLALFSAHLLLICTHYYGWLIVGVELLSVLLWRRKRARTFAALVALLALAAAPWAYLVMHVLNTRTVDLTTQLSWHYRPDAQSLAAYYALLNGPFSFAHSTTFGLLVFGLIILSARWLVPRGADGAHVRRVYDWLLALALLPVACAFVVSRLFPQSVWHTRYLIISAVPYLLLVAFALTSLRPRPLRLALTLFVVAWATLSGLTEMRRTDTRIAWDMLAHELRTTETTRTPPVKVYMLDDFPRYPMNFYLKSAGDERFTFVRGNAADLDALADAHCWLIYEEGAWPRGPSPPELMQARGYQIGASLVSGPRGHRYILFPMWRR